MTAEFVIVGSSKYTTQRLCWNLSWKISSCGCKQTCFNFLPSSLLQRVLNIILSFCSGISLESFGNCCLLSYSADLLSSPTSGAARINQGAKVSKFAHHSSGFAHSTLSYWVWWYSLERFAVYDEISQDFVTCSWIFFFKEYWQPRNALSCCKMTQQNPTHSVSSDYLTLFFF